MPIAPDALAVVTSSGLALIADEHVTRLTGGIMRPPGAVFHAQIVSVDGMRTEKHLDGGR